MSDFAAWQEWSDFTPQERQRFISQPCDMRVSEPPMDFAWCETHDETFPLGGRCRFWDPRKDKK